MNFRRAFPAVILLTLALGCGQAAQTLAPGIALQEAAQATANATSHTFTIRIVGGEAEVRALLGDEAGDLPAWPLIRDSRLQISTEAGRSSSADDRFAAVLDLGDVRQAVELRVVDRQLYLRADVAGLVLLLGADEGVLAELAAGAAEAGFGFVGPALAGRWLSADLSVFDDLAGSGGSFPGVPPVDAQTGRTLMEAFADTFAKDVRVERHGREDAGQRYSLTVPIQRVYERLLPALTGAGMSGLPGVPPAMTVPDRSVTADVWIAGGHVKRAELDLAQFSDEADGRVALRVDVDRLRGDISAPEGAVPVDLAPVFGALLGQFMGFGDGVFN